MRFFLLLTLPVLLSTACGGSAEYACPALHYRETSESGPIPDLTDITHDRGVAQAVSGTTEHPFELEELCVNRPVSLPGVISVSARDVDYGCLSLGFIYQRQYIADVRQSAVALGPLGWAEAGADRKGRLARDWVEQVVMREAPFLDSAPDGFAGHGPEFEPPRIDVTPDGGVVVEGWIQEPSRTGKKRFQLRRFTFDADGNLSATEAGRCFEGGP